MSDADPLPPTSSGIGRRRIALVVASVVLAIGIAAVVRETTDFAWSPAPVKPGSRPEWDSGSLTIDSDGDIVVAARIGSKMPESVEPGSTTCSGRVVLARVSTDGSDVTSRVDASGVSSGAGCVTDLGFGPGPDALLSTSYDRVEEAGWCLEILGACSDESDGLVAEGEYRMLDIDRSLGTAAETNYAWWHVPEDSLVDLEDDANDVERYVTAYGALVVDVRERYSVEKPDDRAELRVRTHQPGQPDTDRRLTTLEDGTGPWAAAVSTDTLYVVWSPTEEIQYSVHAYAIDTLEPRTSFGVDGRLDLDGIEYIERLLVDAQGRLMVVGRIAGGSLDNIDVRFLDSGRTARAEGPLAYVLRPHLVIPGRGYLTLADGRLLRFDLDDRPDPRFGVRGTVALPEFPCRSEPASCGGDTE